MNRLLLVGLLIVGCTQFLFAEPSSLVTKDGFSGLLLVTPDPHWEEKWNTSEDTVPRFTQASTLHYGERLTILTFFANPKPDSRGHVFVVSNLKVIRPDGSLSIDAKDIECAKGQLSGDPGNVRLSPATLVFMGEEGDLPGVWRVEVQLVDQVRGTRLLLKSQFELQKDHS